MLNIFSQVELIRVPGFTLVNSGLPDDTFNYAIDADFSSADANKKISEVTDYFAQKNIPFSWWISPHDQPENLSEHLEDHGYKNAICRVDNSASAVKMSSASLI